MPALYLRQISLPSCRGALGLPCWLPAAAGPGNPRPELAAAAFFWRVSFSTGAGAGKGHSATSWSGVPQRKQRLTCFTAVASSIVQASSGSVVLKGMVYAAHLSLNWMSYIITADQRYFLSSCEMWCL